MDSRLDNYNSNPLFFPEDGKNYPMLLKEAYESLDIEEEEYIEYVDLLYIKWNQPF